MKLIICFLFIILISNRISAHPSYVSLLMTSECKEVHSLEPHQKCKFVMNTPDCHVEARLMDYISFFFCSFGEFGESETGQLINKMILIVWCFVLFIILSVVSDEFFCPGLASMSKMLHLSENIAGVTLLAFGNGAPNFSGSVFDPDQDSELMYSEVLGSAMFMIGVIGGWIAIVKPFKVITFDFLRDVVFLSFSVILIQIFINDDHYSWAEAIETVSLYFIYLLVVFIQFRYDKRQLEKSMEGRLSGVAPLRHITAIRPEIHAQLRKIEEQLDFTIYDEDNIPIDVEETRRMSILPIHDKKVQGANYRLITYFIEELKPFWMKEYKNISWWKLPLEILQNLIFFGMQFILPVFDYTSDRHGWNKLLNILHLFTLPMTALFVTMKTHVTIFGISLVLYSFFISILLACFVFLTSRTDQPPTYHWLYSIFNFLGSNLVIFAATSELASVLNTLGLLFNCTQSIIGVTVLSIGNSVSDLLANITLAKQGHQRMAFSACFGGSIFNILFTVGFTFISKAFDSPDYNPYARRGPLGLNCMIHIILIIFFISLAFYFNSFLARRSYGVMLVGMYIIFIVQCILSELQIIHSYGTDHHNEEFFE